MFEFPAGCGMIGLSRPIGRINPAIHGAKATDPWRLAEHLAELERRVGQPLSTEVHPLEEGHSTQLARRALAVFDLCQVAVGRRTGNFALAQRVRHHVLELALAPGEPIALSLYALCAYMAEAERSSPPPLSRSGQILDWYLSHFLADQPSEIAPADFAALRAVEMRRGASAPALAKIETVSPPARPVRHSAHRTGNVLHSGQQLVLTSKGSGARYLLAGDWNYQEPDHTWSKPWSAMLAFDLVEPIGAKCLMEVDLMLPHLPADMKEQCLITLNSVQILKLTRHGRRTMRLLLPGSALLDGANYLGFHAPDYSPSRYGSADQRKLGVAVSRLRICLDA